MDLIIFAADLAMKREKSKTDASKKTDTKLLVKKGPEQAAKKPRKSKDGKDQLAQEASECLLRLHEKAPYIAKAAKLKDDYTKTMAAYNKGQVLITNSLLFVEQL
ncbi:hypothetical protein ZIOFF_070911 [Zingiber officinale]|uniref:Uncharacterized protein n=1 Tax=Zingiber officinale TaxID=94328 RepID=A0A8J5C966_ZINOF|nr:hypothetical protein ZIOFF_070911 [Zingiber officinale]